MVANATRNRILITGGSGFIGTNLVEYYKNQGWEVVNFDILPPRNQAHAQFWKMVDIRERKQLIDEVQRLRPNFVLHCAARTDLNEKTNLDGYSANFDGICHLIEAIRITGTVDRAIFFSSQLVCRIGYVPKDEHDYLPSTLYGRSKVLGEKILRSAEDFGCTWLILRPTSLWGPWFDMPYKNFFTTIARGFYVHPGQIHVQKQWGFVLNSVYQVHQLLQVPSEKIHKKTFYLSDYSPVLLRDFANAVQSELGRKPIPTAPFAALKLISRLGDILRKIGWSEPPLTSFRLNNIITNEIQDTSSLEQLTGPLPYNFQEGIRITIQWMKQHKLI